MKPGDRVKLTERAARARIKGYKRKQMQTDWAGRRGTITAVGKKYSYVLWDGLLSTDPVAHADIERDEY
jgi:hypothetical protein